MTLRKILQGYVPNLRSFVTKNDQFGFVVTASSYLNNNYHPVYVFNGLYKPGAVANWMANGETKDFWIQIECPDLVRLWRISLRGLHTNTQRIYRWKLEGSVDGTTFSILHEAANLTFLGNEIRFFPIDTTEKFKIFRLFCLEAEPENPGLSHMQLYIYSD